jgi:hypothetical protein
MIGGIRKVLCLEAKASMSSMPLQRFSVSLVIQEMSGIKLQARLCCKDSQSASTDRTVQQGSWPQFSGRTIQYKIVIVQA